MDWFFAALFFSIEISSCEPFFEWPGTWDIGRADDEITASGQDAVVLPAGIAESHDDLVIPFGSTNHLESGVPVKNKGN